MGRGASLNRTKVVIAVLLLLLIGLAPFWLRISLRPGCTVVMLINPGSTLRLQWTMRSLELLNTHWNNWMYPVILFYPLEQEELLTPFFRSKLIRAANPRPTQFVPIKLRSPPPGATKNPLTPGYCWRGFEYGSMCAFFALDLFVWLHQKGYTHVMRCVLFVRSFVRGLLTFRRRLDDDAQVRSPITRDLFADMIDGRAVYGLRTTVPEYLTCAVGLGAAVKEWADLHQKEDFAHFCLPSEMVYNNFFVANVAWFLSPEYQSLMAHIHKKEGIFTSRWGDAPIHTMALNFLLPDRKRILVWDDFEYAHQGSQLSSGQWHCPGGYLRSAKKKKILSHHTPPEADSCDDPTTSKEWYQRTRCPESELSQQWYAPQDNMTFFLRPARLSDPSLKEVVDRFAKNLRQRRIGQRRMQSNN